MFASARVHQLANFIRIAVVRFQTCLYDNNILQNSFARHHLRVASRSRLLTGYALVIRARISSSAHQRDRDAVAIKGARRRL